MSRTVPLSGFAKQHKPPRRWYNYVGYVAGLGGLAGIMAIAGFIVLRFAGEKVSTDALVLQALLSMIGIFVFLVAQSKVQEVETPFLEQNRLDFEASKAIQASISRLLSGSPPVTDNSVPGLRAYQNLRLSEVTPHLNIQATNAIEGWLDHRLGIGGFGLGLQIGRTDLGKVRMGAASQPPARFAVDGAAGEGKAMEGFVAVIEQEAPKGVFDAVQVIVPSEEATRAYIGQFVTTLGRLSGEGSYRDAVLAGSAPLLQRCLTNDVAHVIDRINTILRLPVESRPTVTVIGAEVTAHVVIGGAIQFGDEKNLHQLFPVGLIQKVIDIVVHATDHGPQ